MPFFYCSASAHFSILSLATTCFPYLPPLRQGIVQRALGRMFRGTRSAWLVEAGFASAAVATMLLPSSAHTLRAGSWPHQLPALASGSLLREMATQDSHCVDFVRAGDVPAWLLLLACTFSMSAPVNSVGVSFLKPILASLALLGTGGGAGQRAAAQGGSAPGLEQSLADRCTAEQREWLGAMITRELQAATAAGAAAGKEAQAAAAAARAAAALHSASLLSAQLPASASAASARGAAPHPTTASVPWWSPYAAKLLCDLLRCEDGEAREGRGGAAGDRPLARRLCRAGLEGFFAAAVWREVNWEGEDGASMGASAVDFTLQRPTSRWARVPFARGSSGSAGSSSGSGSGSGSAWGGGQGRGGAQQRCCVVPHGGCSCRPAPCPRVSWHALGCGAPHVQWLHGSAAGGV